MWGADCWGPHIGAAHPQCTGVEGTVDTGVEGDSGGGAPLRRWYRKDPPGHVPTPSRG